jgi:hypothetical protein
MEKRGGVVSETLHGTGTMKVEGKTWKERRNFGEVKARVIILHIIKLIGTVLLSISLGKYPTFRYRRVLINNNFHTDVERENIERF